MDKILKINELIKKYSEIGIISSKNISDGHHTFREIYNERFILFCVICNIFPELSWKAKKHFDEENDSMYEGDFIAGINTPEGVVTYHIKLKYWDLFDITEINRAPKYDNYTSEDVMNRILSLIKNNPHRKKSRSYFPSFFRAPLLISSNYLNFNIKVDSN